MYYPIRTAFATSTLNYPTLVIGQAQKLIYEIEYEVGGSIPSAVKYATVMVLGNMLMSDYWLGQTGAPGSSSGVSGFTSGQYSVQYG